MSSSSPSSASNATPQQIGKAFVVQYYRLLHEHPESLHRFYAASSTFMHDDQSKTVTGTDAIAKLIEGLALKQRHVKIRQVDCHSTVGASVVVQVCGEISTAPVADSHTHPIMKRFVQTFVLTPADHSRQKYYVHNDIFRYQDSPTPTSSTENVKTPSSHNEATTFGTSPVAAASSTVIETPLTPSASNIIEFFDNTSAEPKDAAEQAKEQPSKPKSYRDAIGKKEKPAATPPPAEPQPAAPAIKGNKSVKQPKKPAPKATGTTARAPRGHPQDANDYYDDSWYYENGTEGYLSTGYTDDQEVFVGNLSAQVTEDEIHALFRPYGSLLLVRIGNTGSQVGAANFAFVVCQSIEMAQAIVADHETLLQTQKIKVEAKKRRPFPHTFRPTYPTAASPTSYQSTGYPQAYYNQAAYYEGAPTRGARRGARGAMK